LTEEIPRLLDQAAGLTTYLGPVSAPWDLATPTYKFSSQESL